MNFFTDNVDVKKINLCIFVGKGACERVHKNRYSYGLAFFNDGVNEINFEGYGNLKMQKNDIVFFPKGSNYVVSSKYDGACFAVNFDLFEDVELPPFVLPVKNRLEMEDYFKRITYAWEHKQPGCEMKCRALLYSIIYLIQKEYGSKYINQSKLRIIAPAVKYLAENYIESNLSIGNLSKICGISETYFRSLFVSYYGIPPIKYINNLRLKRASELLKSGYYSVSEVMQMSGYTDDAYFSRAFKKCFGVSPAQYRNNDKNIRN